MAATRCTASPRDLFFFIMCVASISVLFNFQISYYGSRTFVDQRQSLDEVFGGQNVQEHSGMYDVKILGRSLNQHEAETLRKGSTERLELLTKLKQIENRLLKAKQRVIAVDGDETQPAENMHANRLKQLDIDLVKKNDEVLLWINKDTVIQGNWSVLFCFNENSCPKMQTDISQKVDRIPEIVNIIKTPEVLCSISKMAERNSDGKLTEPCGPFNCDYQLNESTLLVTGNTAHYNITSQEFCTRQISSPRAFVWYLPDKPITFPGGPVLRIHTVITSVSPLRVYVHPEMLSGPLLSLEYYSLLRKISLEDLLQYISEVYGLGVSSHWWMEVQRRFLLYMVYLEKEIQKSETNGYKMCNRCFQPLEIDMVCSSVQRCQIIQIRTDQSLSFTVISSTKKLVASSMFVSEEAERVLARQHVDICNSINADEHGVDCISENYVVYVLDWRREMKSTSDMIPVYPSEFGCKLLSKMENTSSEQSDTVNFNTVTRSIGEDFQWSDQSSVESQVGEDYTDMRLTKQGRSTEGTTGPCSNDPDDFGKINGIFTYPETVLEEISPHSYNTSVGYDTILVRVMAVSKSCKCQVKLENKYNDPGARNITLGLGNNKIMLYVVDTTSQDMGIVNTITISIYRHNRGLNWQEFDEQRMKMCGLKQDCSLKFNNNADCGLIDLKSSWTNENRRTRGKTRCQSGDNEGQWVVPCRSCSSENYCLWGKAKWRPYDCQYEQFSPSSLKHCLQGKKLLFIGDSTNRGVSNYIIEQINGSLYDWDKTHSTRVYTNINNNKTQFTFAYYPHFWLPADHRPRFSKVIYQLIKSSLPLQNNSNTVLVVGGVHWLAKQHIDLIIEALQRKGLSGITKVVKGLGAGFHQPVESVRFVPKSEHVHLLQRESDILNYAKTNGFHAVATFNMTISRYKDFLEGNCACHFHKVTKHGSQNEGFRYTVEGDINAVYSQILLNQICQGG
ncbi:cadherin-like and PC-esterase domain-containing protein 1 isoform X2 [Mercenaria mercenaria]|uniref:cadherin-like and PC-esterase domain-containing protein 1 isoform X2 n=1 Tax=Mercenaria mercenaria TaxID=6596 RepID=UPI00234E8C82|nr:cadherin-like and PC-esterase domain-containing protein 1 isoform X2 [Mercenaria mercenaria]